MLNKSRRLLTVILCMALCLAISCGDDDSPTRTDTTRPTVVSTMPASDATGVAVDAVVQVSFSERIASSSVSDTCLIFNGDVTGTAACSACVITFTPDANLQPSFSYTVVVKNSIADLAGNALAEDYTWSFSTIGLIPLPSLIGEWAGIYAYTTGYGTASEATAEYPIFMRFSDQSYWMFDAGGQDAICEPSGEYVMGDNVELTQVNDGCAGTSGEADWNPVGSFALRQPDDSVVMTQILSDTLKVIRLVPAVE